jgi:two-component system response regulator
MTNTQASKAQNILLVDDSPEDYEATARAFRKANLMNEMVWRQSGQDALDYLRQQNENEEGSGPPGIILLDLNMPGLDGHQTLRHIKEDASLRHIPVIILTTSSDERDVTACYQMGANTYIQKPISFEGLLTAINRLKEYWFGIALLPKENEHE